MVWTLTRFQILGTSFDTLSSDHWNDVGHQISVNPFDDAGINSCDLKQGGDLGVSGATIYPNHISYAPSPVLVSNDHVHACFDVKKDWS